MLQHQNRMTPSAPTLVLEISETAIALAETFIETQTTAQAAWTAYEHHLALETLINWFDTYTDDMVTAWLPRDARAAFWEGVSGAALDWGGVRLALFATEREGSLALTVPQEWLDAPELVADYYLFVEIHREAEDSWLEVVGYATRAMLLEQGDYQAAERSYALARAQLVADLNLLFLSQRLFGVRRPSIAPWPTLTPAQAQTALAQCQAAESPRLVLPFEQWGALFSQVDWRSQLYESRLAVFTQATAVDTPSATPSPTVAPPKTQTNTVALGKWFEQLGNEIQTIGAGGWQTLEAIAERFTTPEPVLAYSYARDAGTPIPTAVPGLLELLAARTDKGIHLSALDLLGRIGQGNPQAVAALVKFERSTQDPDLRREAAVSLGKIDPSNPAAGVRLGKIVDLGIQIGQAPPLMLVVTLLPEQTKTNVQVRLKGVSNRATLPENVMLHITDEDGNILREARSRSHDQVLQLALRASQGDQFSTQVSLGSNCFTELFTV